MFFTYELEKGKDLNIKQFLIHDKNVHVSHYHNFAQYSGCYLKNKQLCIQMWDKCLSLDPNNGFRWKCYGECIQDFGCYFKSIDCFLKCDKLNYQNEGRWQFTLAYVYYHIGFFTKAQKYIFKSLNLNNDRKIIALAICIQ